MGLPDTASRALYRVEEAEVRYSLGDHQLDRAKSRFALFVSRIILTSRLLL
jgi:hypothetical protein